MKVVKVILIFAGVMMATVAAVAATVCKLNHEDVFNIYDDVNLPTN